MIKYTSTNQIKIEEFKTPFELKLDSTNRWVRLSSIMPWDDLVKVYTNSLSRDQGRPSIDGRIVVGALYIKHKQNLSDRETTETIRENPYIQYFLGLDVYHSEELFTSSLFVDLRKRMGLDKWDEFNKIIIKKAGGIVLDEQEDREDNGNEGTLIVDATVADQYIKYPTDLDLLNDSREWSEKIIDEFYLKGDFQIGEKPRTYRRVARCDYLKISKKKNKTKKQIRRGLKLQLNYLKRNLRYIDIMVKKFEVNPFPLSKRSERYLGIIRTVYQQQKWMYRNKGESCKDRIVSLHQSHVRPIVRGKASSKVEFGAKIGLSLDNGYARINNLSWDAYNESSDLKVQVESYKSIHGYYPELVVADRIYATRENRSWLKERGIRLTAESLGRKSKVEESNYNKRKKKNEAKKRNHIEGKFGQGKNGYNLNKIRARLDLTSESWIGTIIFVMNIVRFQQELLC